MVFLASSVLFYNTSCELAKREISLGIYEFIQIGLRKDGQRISRDSTACPASARVDALDEMRHGLEFAPRDQFQSFACLERQTVTRDADLVDLPRPRTYV